MLLVIVIWAPHSLITVLRWQLVGDAFGKLPLFGREYVLNLFALGSCVCVPWVLVETTLAIDWDTSEKGRGERDAGIQPRHALLWLQLLCYRLTMQSKIDRRRILGLLPIPERVYENYVIPILCEVTRVVSVVVIWLMLASGWN